MNKWWKHIPNKGVYVVETPTINDDFNPPPLWENKDIETFTRTDMYHAFNAGVRSVANFGGRNGPEFDHWVKSYTSDSWKNI